MDGEMKERSMQGRKVVVSLGGMMKVRCGCGSNQFKLII